jgi:hypothetical protein
MSLKNPVTLPGIDPETVRLVAQCLNHYATPGPPSELIEHLTNGQISVRKYFASAKEEVSWGKNPFSALTEDFDLPLREGEQLIDIVADRNQIDTFKWRLFVNFGLCLQVNTQKLQSMADNTYCLLFQHIAVRQQF